MPDPDAPMPVDVVNLQPYKLEGGPVTEPFRALEDAGRVRMRYLEFALARQASWILRGREHSPWSRWFRNLREVPRLLAGRGAVVVVGAEPFSELTFALRGLKRRHRCIYFTSWSWQHETFEHRFLGRYRRAAWSDFLRDLACVSVNPAPVAALEAFGARAHFIPHPVRTDIFRPAEAPRPDGGPVRVLFAGHLEKFKGIHHLLRLIRERPWDGIAFDVVGRGSHEGEVRALEAAGRPVRYLGFVRDRAKMAEIYRGADLLVLPSMRIGRNEEKFGLVLTEAMASGLPCIATDCVGPRQVLEDGVTGQIIPQNDPDALEAAVRALAGDPARRRDLGRAARRRAEAVYALDIVAAQWGALIESVARGEESA